MQKRASGAAGRSAPESPSRKAINRPCRKVRPARPPRTAAVTVTTAPGGISYAEALRLARSSVNLEELGIDGLRPRRAVTGGLVLEIPGAKGGEKAHALAQKMREALAGTGVRIARPIKRAELRVGDLDDSVTPEDVAAAVAGQGSCPQVDVQVGQVRRSPSGMGTAWVRCPLAAARKLAAGGRIRVGWVSASVTPLEARPLRCFKCLEMGHVRVACPSQVDRSGLCYRCGEQGHRAGECLAPLKCVLCAERGLPANHRLGVGLCSSGRPPKIGGRAGAGPQTFKPPDPPRSKRARAAKLANVAQPAESSNPPSDVPMEVDVRTGSEAVASTLPLPSPRGTSRLPLVTREDLTDAWVRTAYAPVGGSCAAGRPCPTPETLLFPLPQHSLPRLSAEAAATPPTIPPVSGKAVATPPTLLLISGEASAFTKTVEVGDAPMEEASVAAANVEATRRPHTPAVVDPHRYRVDPEKESLEGPTEAAANG